jgi:hypothetical protein
MNHGMVACSTHESTDRLARRRLPGIRRLRTVVSVRTTCGCGDAQLLGPSASCFHPSRGNAASMFSRSTSRIGGTPSERAASTGAAPFVREIIDADQDACCQGARALNRVFELPDVPRPRIVEDSLQCATREPGDRLIYSLGNPCEQCVRQTSEIVEPLAQSRNVESANV